MSIEEMQKYRGLMTVDACQAHIDKLEKANAELLDILEKCLRDEENRRKKLKNASTASCYADQRMDQMREVVARAKVAR